MEFDNSKKVLLKNTVMLYFMTATKYILPFIVTGCLTHRLSADNYGIITYIMAVMNYFLIFFDFGFNFSATKRISKNRENCLIVQQIISQVFTGKLLLCGVGIGLLVCIIPLVPILRENFLLTVLYFLATAANILIPDYLYRGLEKMEYVTIRYVVSKMISTILIFLIVTDYEKIILIPIFNLLGILVAAILTIRNVKNKLGYTIDIVSCKEAFSSIRESFIYFISMIASSILSAFNTIIMGFGNFSNDEIAYWGIAFQVVSAVQALYEPITSSIYPHVVVKKDYKFVVKLTSLLSALVVIGCVILYFASGIIIQILSGQEYLPAVKILRMLLPVIIFSFPGQMFGFPLLGAMGKQKQVTISTVITAIFHIV